MKNKTGQVIDYTLDPEAFDPSHAIDVELKAGQVSFHDRSLSRAGLWPPQTSPWVGDVY